MNRYYEKEAQGKNAKAGATLGQFSEKVKPKAREVSVYLLEIAGFGKEVIKEMVAQASSTICS